MKKFTKVFALLAGVTLSFAAVGFAACSGGSDSEVTMTEEDIQTVNSAFTAMEVYSGSYAISETSVTDLKYDNEYYAEYEGSFSSDSVVSYDQTSGNMVYDVNCVGTGVYSSTLNMNMEVGYYTIKNSDTDYTQYAKVNSSNTNSKRATSYTSAPSNYYYEDYNACVSEVFKIDLSEGAKCTTAAEYALFFENKLSDNISTLSSVYGLDFTFIAGNCVTVTEGDDTIYRFTASTSASGEYSSVTISDAITYTIDIYLDTTDASSIKISKLNITLEQKLTTGAQGITVTATATTTTSEIFSYVYNSSAMPTDFSDYS